MIYSMTGYGKAEGDIGAKRVTVEIKSVNSKNFDCSIRTPSYFRPKEMEIRAILSRELMRGKIEVNVNFTTGDNQQKHHINKTLVKQYCEDLREIANELGTSTDSASVFIPIAMKMPEVLQSEKEELTEEEAQKYIDLVTRAIIEFNKFRVDEGFSLQEDITQNIQKILQFLDQIIPYEKERIITLKERLRKNLKTLSEDANIDENRFHQELIYYIEKLDISEEKTRLKAHCEHYIKTVESPNISKGKKLGFITQEIGREINTLGSKANHTEMQKKVVFMKDALEKIKEQNLNIL